MNIAKKYPNVKPVHFKSLSDTYVEMFNQTYNVAEAVKGKIKERKKS